MEVARKVGGEIVSMDAFQIYRGMNIGTAKSKEEDRRDIPHHLLDIVEPEVSFSAADYRREAEQVLADLRERKKPALWVGGTGLYHRVMTEGLSSAPRTDPHVAKEIERLATPAMAEEMKRIDPAWAKTGDLQNRRRMVRALAVFRQSGRTMTEWQTQETKTGSLSGTSCFLLMPAMEVLTRVIRQRIEKMLAEGWVEEVRHLLQRETWRHSPGSRAIGYEEIVQVVEGRINLEEAKEKIAAHTRAYAKRQLTWFRGLPNTHLIDFDPQLAPTPKALETLVKGLVA